MLLSFGSDDTVACVLFIYLFVHKVYFGLLIYICSLDGKFGLQKRAQRASPQSGALKSQTGHTAHSTDDSRARQKCVEKCARVSREACRRVHHILKSEKLYFLFNLTLARGVPACCSVNTVQARVKRETCGARMVRRRAVVGSGLPRFCWWMRARHAARQRDTCTK